MNITGWSYLALVLAVTLPSFAEGTGSEVVVVYNTRAPESKGVAEYYAKRRQVPDNQVFGFSLPTTQDISRSDFNSLLQRPLLRALDDEGLWRRGTEVVRGTNGRAMRVEHRLKQSRIRYVVLCYGVPTRITRDAELKENGEDQLRPELRRNEAAVDTELALLPAIDQKLILAGPLNNPVFAATNGAWINATNGVLMVTRLDGPSAEIARGLVDKAIEAELTGLWGRAYFDLRSTTEPGYKMGDDWIRNAAEISRRLGFETVVDERPETFPAEFPMSQIAIYCGWYDGNVSGPFTRTNVEFMPGAFAYHLHSFSAANLRSPSQNWVGPLLARGATLTMGAVAEPYLGGTPEVAIFVSRLIYHGMTYGEAAYAAQPVLSWQTTIVGDPLCRPFGKSPDALDRELEQQHSPLSPWSELRKVNMNQARGVPLVALAAHLAQSSLTTNSAVLTEKLADIYAALGKPSSAISTYEQALKLDPSPQQRSRLRLTLGEKLADANRDQEAYDQYLKLLQENPDYPNRLVLYRRMLSLAQRMGHRDDVARYEDLIRALTPPPPATTNK